MAPGYRIPCSAQTCVAHFPEVRSHSSRCRRSRLLKAQGAPARALLSKESALCAAGGLANPALLA
jgi:hypothetical protein